MSRPFFLLTMSMIALAFGAQLLAIEPQDDENVILEFAVNPNDGIFKLPVSIGEQRVLFAIDTGASTMAVDSALQPYLGEKIRDIDALTSAGSKTISTFRGIHAKAGRWNLSRRSEVAVIDFGPLSRTERNELKGVIGMTDLRWHIFEFDYDHNVIRILKALRTEPMQRIPLRYPPELQPHVECVIGEMLSEEFMIDTGGFEGILIRSAVYDRLVDSGEITSTGGRPGTDIDGRCVVVDCGRIKRFAIGHHVLRNLVVCRGKTNMLSQCFLNRFLVTFDFPKHALYLQQGRRFNEPDRTGIAGFGVSFVQDDLQVVTISEKGTAAQAGLKLNDVIEQIDDENIVGKTLFQIRRALEKAPSKALSLRVRRDGNFRDITIMVPNVE